MLQRSKIREVSMFSLIALYFEYRKMRTAPALTLATATQPIGAANDAGSNLIASTAA
jgi:hypothetical protein